MTLTGSPGSMGTVRGRARRLTDPSQIPSLQQGDVLVVNETTPDWIEAFRLLQGNGGMVTAQGGLLCHAAIVCREYKIPCVVGMGPAMSSIPDLATVTVTVAGRPPRGTVEVEA